MVNIFRKNRFTYLGTYEGVEIYSEKKYAFIFTDESAKEILRVFYRGHEVALALRLTGPVNRIEEISNEISEKPVTVEAWKANDFESDDKLPEWVFQAFIDRNVGETGKQGFDYYVNTLEGKMYFNNGDYLIQGVHGEIYSCKPDIFEETYSDVSQLEENQERIITLDSYEDISLELVLVNDEVNEYRVTGGLEKGWSYWFTDFEEAINSYNKLKIER